MKPKKLAIFVFHPTVHFDGKDHVKPHHGRFFDEVASSFKKVFIVAPYWKIEDLPDWFDPNNPAYHYEIQSKNIEIVKGLSGRLSYIFRFIQQFFYILKSDAILFFTPSMGSIFFSPFLILMKKKYYCYVAVSPQKHFDEKWGSGFLSKIFFVLQKFAVQHSSGVLATGSGNLKIWKSHPNIHRVIPLLDYEPEFHQNSAQNLEHKKWNFLFVGMIMRRKGPDRAIQFISELKKAGIPAKLNLVGAYSEEAFPTPEEKEYFDSLKKLIHDLKLEQDVRFIGFVSDREEMKKLYRSHEFLVLFSDFEGFPKVVYESMMEGCIPVLSNLDSYDGFLRDQVHAVLVDPPYVQNALLRVQNLQEDQKLKMRSEALSFLKTFLSRKASDQFLGFFK